MKKNSKKVRSLDILCHKSTIYWSVKEATEYFGISKPTLYRWNKQAIEEGQQFIVGRAGYIIDRTALERWFRGDK
jgi:transposase